MNTHALLPVLPLFLGVMPAANAAPRRGTATPRGSPRPTPRGDLAVCRWRAGERDFLMLLARYRGKWQVLEPALGL